MPAVCFRNSGSSEGFVVKHANASCWKFRIAKHQPCWLPSRITSPRARQSTRTLGKATRRTILKRLVSNTLRLITAIILWIQTRASTLRQSKECGDRQNSATNGIGVPRAITWSRIWPNSCGASWSRVTTFLSHCWKQSEIFGLLCLSCDLCC